MSKFTPGPWEVAETNMHGESEIKAREWGICITAGGMPWDECTANAALIADAPALLKLLARIVYDLPQNRGWLDPALEQEAKELIAKHRGGK